LPRQVSGRLKGAEDFAVFALLLEAAVRVAEDFVKGGAEWG
jgi:hypothetical protein